MIIVVMGVSGSGKTSIGTLLAEAIECAFLEGDSLHSKENVEKMRHGTPLTNADRAPWLTAIRTHILKSFKSGENLVVACSALKQQYRVFLSQGVDISWVYLKGSAELIHSRMKRRLRHFMKADMLASQIETLEEPPDALIVDISPSPSVIVTQILRDSGDHGQPFETVPPLNGLREGAPEGWRGANCSWVRAKELRTLAKPRKTHEGGIE